MAHPTQGGKSAPFSAMQNVACWPNFDRLTMSARCPLNAKADMRALVRNLPNELGPLSQMVICSINVGSSTGAFELLTRCETGHRCSRSSGDGLSSS